MDTVTLTFESQERHLCKVKVPPVKLVNIPLADGYLKCAVTNSVVAKEEDPPFRLNLEEFNVTELVTGGVISGSGKAVSKWPTAAKAIAQAGKNAQHRTKESLAAVYDNYFKCFPETAEYRTFNLAPDGRTFIETTQLSVANLLILNLL